MHPNLDRRAFLTSAASAALSGWLGRLAAAPDVPRHKLFILLAMASWPSHFDMSDPKPTAPREKGGRPACFEGSKRIGRDLPSLLVSGIAPGVRRSETP